MTPEQMNELLEAAKPSIIEGLKKELSASITYEAKQAMFIQISEHVSLWIKENVIPEVTKNLVESKEGLVSIASSFADKAVDEISTVLADTLKKNLETSYKRSAIMKALFE